MLRLLFDEDLNHNIVRGLIRRLPDVDYKTVQDLGLEGQQDAAILEAAAVQERLVISHDVNSMTAAFASRIAAEQPPCGLLLIPQSLSIGQAIDDLELICRVGSPDDWTGVMDFLPV